METKMNTDRIGTKLGSWVVKHSLLYPRALEARRDALEVTVRETTKGLLVVELRESGHLAWELDSLVWRDMLYVSEVLIARMEDSVRKGGVK